MFYCGEMKSKRGRPKVLAKATITSICLEKELLNKVRKKAFNVDQSVSQWMADAAEMRIVFQDNGR